MYYPLALENCRLPSNLIRLRGGGSDFEFIPRKQRFLFIGERPFLYNQ